MTTSAAVVMSGRRMVASSPEVAAVRAGVARNLLLFLAAPFVGLAYIIVFPFVGCAAVARAAILRH